MNPPHEPTRRSALAWMVGGLAAPALPAVAAAAPATAGATASGWIDTHHHFLPPVYVAAVGADKLSRTMPNGRVPDWTPEGALAMLDANGIGEGILSISAGPPVPEAANTLRQCNDAAAALRARYPGRFGSFASLPLPDVDASLKEIAYAGDQLRADGFIVFTNYGGRYLGDPLFQPLLEELNRRKAVVFIHPTRPAYDIVGQPNPALIEFTFETTRTAFSLMWSQADLRFPDIRFILSHAGGTLPYLSTRIETTLAMEPALKEKVPDARAALRSFYFDTALSVGAPALAALTEFADPTHIVFGTDFPMASLPVVGASAEGMRALASRAVTAGPIGRQNAARLLGRVA